MLVLGHWIQGPCSVGRAILETHDMDQSQRPRTILSPPNLQNGPARPEMRSHVSGYAICCIATDAARSAAATSPVIAVKAAAFLGLWNAPGLRWRWISSMTNLRPVQWIDKLPTGDDGHFFWCPRVDDKRFPTPVPAFSNRRVSRQTTGSLRRDHRCRRGDRTEAGESCIPRSAVLLCKIACRC